MDVDVAEEQNRDDDGDAARREPDVFGGLGAPGAKDHACGDHGARSSSREAPERRLMGPAVSTSRLTAATSEHRVPGLWRSSMR
jgi:hypothetical protein